MSWSAKQGPCPEMALAAPCRRQAGPEMLRPLARGLRILSVFTSEDAWLGNLEIATRAGLPAPTTNRLIKSLVMLEYLEYSRERRKYRLAPAALSIGYTAASSNDVKEHSRAELQSFANEHRVFIAICERGRLDAVVVEHCRSKLAILDLKIGEHVPLAMSAAGWALLSALPKAERDYLMTQIKRRYDGAWPFISRGIAQAMARIENRGYCTFVGDWRQEVTSVAVPLITSDGSYVNALVCSGSGRFLTMRRVAEEVGPALVEAAGRIRGQLPPTVN